MFLENFGSAASNRFGSFTNAKLNTFRTRYLNRPVTAIFYFCEAVMIR